MKDFRRLQKKTKSVQKKLKEYDEMSSEESEIS
ncbi:hypothetical protein TorRG33x02_055470 [Trema orientale]|uniref:Uncharacterized protein n=1 Tax=Trema orientale TaxID=63057 RepID=A0A2P5FLH2_TREOI|nr:hypothetical protein TorRG33x02_055470 [Trema orientale]